MLFDNFEEECVRIRGLLVQLYLFDTVKLSSSGTVYTPFLVQYTLHTHTHTQSRVVILVCVSRCVTYVCVNVCILV